MENKMYSNDQQVNRLVLNIKDRIDKFCSVDTDNGAEIFQIVADELNRYNANRVSFENKLIHIGQALSAEKNLDALLEMIVIEAMNFTSADGGTIYVMNKDETALEFKIMLTNSLGYHLGGTSSNKIPFPPVQLYDEKRNRNEKQVSAFVALSGKTIKIDDVYEVSGFDFQGTKKFDLNTGYRSKSMLVIAMKNHDEEVIGVLQLLNAKDDENVTIPFPESIQPLVESLASQAAIAITNAMLIEDLKELLDSFIKSIAVAIDDKTPYTAGHIQRVAELTLLIADGMNAAEDGVWRDFHLNLDEKRELKTAAWMHDVGKISTPVHVMDKGTKLESKYDRIQEISLKFEIMKRDLEIESLKKKLESVNKGADRESFEQIDLKLKEKFNRLDDDKKFLITANTGSEFTSDKDIERINELAGLTLTAEGRTTHLLSEDEQMNLSVRRGTLNDEERKVIQDHVWLTIKMLQELPWPRKMSRVTEYAGSHHETLNGTGYPLGLTGDQLATQSRIIAVADVFEALSAPDRPYKKGKKLSECVKILGFMVKDQHLDGDIVRFFITSGLILEYAMKELSASQRDDFTFEGVNYKINDW